MVQPPKSEALAWVEDLERRDPGFRERVEAELAAMRLEQEILQRLAEGPGRSAGADPGAIEHG